MAYHLQARHTNLLILIHLFDVCSLLLLHIVAFIIFLHLFCLFAWKVLVNVHFVKCDVVWTTSSEADISTDLSCVTSWFTCRMSCDIYIYLIGVVTHWQQFICITVNTLDENCSAAVKRVNALWSYPVGLLCCEAQKIETAVYKYCEIYIIIYDRKFID